MKMLRDPWPDAHQNLTRAGPCLPLDDCNGVLDQTYFFGLRQHPSSSRKSGLRGVGRASKKIVTDRETGPQGSAPSPRWPQVTWRQSLLTGFESSGRGCSEPGFRFKKSHFLKSRDWGAGRGCGAPTGGPGVAPVRSRAASGTPWAVPIDSGPCPPFLGPPQPETGGSTFS